MILSLTILWVVFYAYWLISAIGVKKTVRGRPRWQGARLRVLLVAAALLLFRWLRVRRIVPLHYSFGPAIGFLGLAFCVSGFGLAVWARLNLGRNWGVPMSLKEGHELVTTGPYRFIRHPIYTGILLAMLGSGLVAGPLWFLAFVVFCPFFVYSARTEERLMMQQFPDQYPEYRKRTYALIPLVW